MVLPIGPSDLNLIQMGQLTPADLKNQKITGYLPRIPVALPNFTYQPSLTFPKQLSIIEYSNIVNTAVNHLREMEYFGIIANELITRRFYQAIASDARGHLDLSMQLAYEILNSELNDPNYQTYLQGLNALFPSGDPTGSINQVVSSYNAGVSNENTQIGLLNQAITDYTAANPPYQAIDPQSVINLDSAINSYNSYAALRNAEIQNYNIAVASYNSSVGIADPNTGVYPPGTINSAIQTFNQTYAGQGELASLPYLPNLTSRAELPAGLPLADPDSTFTTNFNQYLNLPITDPISPYTAYQYLDIAAQSITVNSPTFGGIVSGNTAILNYNSNDVPAQQQAVNDLNNAIIAFNSVTINGVDNPAYGDTSLLLAAINTYNDLVNTSPNLNGTISLFNTEVVDAINNLAATPYPSFDQAVGVVNGEFPAALNYSTPPNLPQVPLMPAAPSTASLIAGEVPLLISTPQLYPEFNYAAIALATQPSPFTPYINADGTVRVDSLGNPLITMPTADGIPPTITGGDFSEINDIFAPMNTTIATYNLTVGDPGAPPPPTPPLTTENDMINYLNSMIDAYQANPTPATFADLEAAINTYNTTKASTFDPLIGDPSNPPPGSFNAAIIAFNTGTGPNTLYALNTEIATLNVARAAYGLLPIPSYTPLPLRSLLPDAPTLAGIPPTIADNPPSSFFTLSNRSDYISIPLISETAIDSIYVFDQSQMAFSSIQGIYFNTFQELNDPNVLGYINQLTSGAADIAGYDTALSTYQSSALAAPAAGKTTADYPPLSVSGGSIQVDAATQQAVNENIASKMVLGTLTQTDIDEYNNYADLVNNTSLAAANSAIAAFNTEVGNTGTPSVYTPGSLNWYAQQANSEFGTGTFLGPLTIVDEISPIAAMPQPLPNIGDVIVNIAGNNVDFYSAIAQLNSAASGEPVGPITLSQLNADIAAYNGQVPSENSAIDALNSELSVNFPADVAGSGYFTALSNLDSYINGTYNPAAGTLDSGISTLNSTISSFNSDSLNNLNAFAASSITAINDALAGISFPAGAFETMQPLSQLASQGTMPGAPDVNSGLIPGQVPLLPDGTPYPAVGYSLNLTNRLSTIPTTIPRFFSITGIANSLEQLNSTIYTPVIDNIQAYNGTTGAAQGVTFEQNAVAALNAAITAYNSGSITSDDLKIAIDTYVQTISTNVPNVNDNIATLNSTIASGIQTWQNALANANTRLQFWGFPALPQLFNMDLRSPMQSPPIPTGGFAQTFPSQVSLLSDISPQSFPSQSLTIEQLGQTLLTLSPLSLDYTTFLNISILNIFNQFFAKYNLSIQTLEKILASIERFVELRAFLRGPNVASPNIYIEPRRLPLNPIGDLSRVPLAEMALGLTNQSFESLLNADVIASVMSIFDLPDSQGIVAGLRTSMLGVTNRAALYAAFRSLAALYGRIAPPSLDSVLRLEGTPVPPVFALGFLEELRNLITSGVTEDIVRETLGLPALNPRMVEGLTAGFNLSLLNLGGVLLEKIYGVSIIQGLINITEPKNDLPGSLGSGEFDSVLRSSLGAVGEKIAGGLRQLIADGVIVIKSDDLDSFVQNEILNRLTSIFHTPQQFFDSLNFLIAEAAGQGQIRPLRLLAFDAAAYVADQLPSAIINKEVLDSAINWARLNNGALHDALMAADQSLSSDQASALEVDALQSLIQQSELDASIAEQNALQYRLQQDDIRNALIYEDALANAELENQLKLADIQYAIQQSQILRDGINRFDLAQKAVEALIQRDITLQANINLSQLSYEIQSRQLADSRLNENLLKFQTLFDRRQQEAIKSEMDARLVMQQAIEEAFPTINASIAGAIAQSVSVSFVRSNAPLLINDVDIVHWRQIFYDLVRKSLEYANEQDRKVFFDLIRREVLDSHNSYVQLVHDQITKLREFQDQNLDRILEDEKKKVYNNIQNLGDFVVNRLLDPAYSLLYSANTGLMYEHPEKNNYIRNIDIMV